MYWWKARGRLTGDGDAVVGADVEEAGEEETADEEEEEISSKIADEGAEEGAAGTTTCGNGIGEE